MCSPVICTSLHSTPVADICCLRNILIGKAVLQISQGMKYRIRPSITVLSIRALARDYSQLMSERTYCPGEDGGLEILRKRSDIFHFCWRFRADIFVRVGGAGKNLKNRNVRRTLIVNDPLVEISQPCMSLVTPDLISLNPADIYTTSQKQNVNFVTSKVKKCQFTNCPFISGYVCRGTPSVDLPSPILQGVRIWTPFRVPIPERRVERFRCFRVGKI